MNPRLHLLTLHTFTHTYIVLPQAAAELKGEGVGLRLMGKAHGCRSGPHWLWVNFPTDAERAFVEGKGMPAQTKRKGY